MHPLARRLMTLAALLSPFVVLIAPLALASVARAQEVVTTQRSLPDAPPADPASRPLTPFHDTEAVIEAPRRGLAAPASSRRAPALARSSTAAADTPEPAQGFHLVATMKNHALDMTSPDHEVDGPTGSLMSEAAGVGWRRDNLSAMVGYMRPDDQTPAYRDESIQYHKPHGRVGIGLSLHY